MPRVTWLYAAIAGLFLVVGLQQAGQAYLIDEAVFPYVSSAVADTGRPVFYNGVLRPENVGIWHPPGYVYVLAGWIVVFGDSAESVRLFGLVTALMTAGLVAWLIRLVRPASPPVIAAVVFGLYLFHPLVVQSSLVPDIDGTVGVLALTASLAVAVRVAIAERRESWHVLALALLLCASLWTKFTTPLVLIPIYVLALRPGASGWLGWGRDALVTILLGVAAFMGSWWVLSEVIGLPFWFPFEFTAASFGKGGVGGLSVAELLSKLRPNALVWLWTAPVFALLSLAGGVLAFTRWRTPTDRGLRLVALYAVAVYLAYNVIAGVPFGFPKYWIAAIPAMAVLGGAVLVDAWAAVSPIRWRFEGGARYASWAVGAVAVGAVVGVVHVRLVQTAAWPFWIPPEAGSRLILASYVVAAIVIVALVRVPLRPKSVAAVAGGALVVTVLALNVGLTLVQRSADYSVRYYYGQTGTAQAIADVQELTNPGEVIIAAKDIGLQAGRPFYEDAGVFADPEALSALIESGDVELIVTRCTWDYSESVYPDAFSAIRESAVPVIADLGSDYVLWRPLVVADDSARVSEDEICLD